MAVIIAQVLSFFGAGLNALSFQQKTRKNIITVQICAAITFIIHYILLGAYTGAALNGISLFRSIVFVNNDKKWAKNPMWLIFFVVLNIVSSILTWSDWSSILPAIAMSLTTVSYWLKNEKYIRIVTFPSSPCWLVYNIITGSIGGIVTEILVMSSILIAIVRYDILKYDILKKEKKIKNAS